MYAHVVQVAQMALIAAERCANGTVPSVKANFNVLRWLVYATGRFPPVKIKAPRKVEAMVSNYSKEEARNQLIKLANRVNAVSPMLQQASTQCKISHPRLGLLNAWQWFEFINIHSMHHTKQLLRIGNSLKIKI